MKSPASIYWPYLRLSLVILTLASFHLPQLFAQEEISDSAMRQIRELQKEKASRSPVHRKLDAQFVFQLKRNRGLTIAPGVNDLRTDVETEPDGRVLVDIDAEVTQALLDQITRGGGTVIHSSPTYHSIRAQAALDQLENLAALPGVKFLRRASKARTNTGSVNSEGDTTHRASFARTNYSVTGAGVKVGVLSDGVTYLANSQANGNLGSVTVLPGQAGPAGTREGVAMLEIIHDLAPDAELYFATGYSSPANYAQNILDLRSNGCDIIVDDLMYKDESPFQDGIIAQAVNTVTASGAMYFSAAGNEGNFKDGSSGTWEGNFVNSGQTMPGYGGQIHSFGGTNYNPVLATGQGVDLFWADPLGASTNDYDLFLLNATGSSVVYAANNLQTGTQDPYEFVNRQAFSNERVVVVKSSGATRFLHVDTYRGRLGLRTTGATRGHSAATNALCVAAVNAASIYPNPFTAGSSNHVRTYSCDGPRRMFFHADGTAITPGNYSATGGALRQKPDLTAADSVSTSVLGYSPFNGTSAAAPHAAAIAALLWSFDSSLNPTEIRSALTNTALDIEAPGFDVNSGAGIVMAAPALMALPPRPVISVGSTALVQESCANDAFDPGEKVTVALSLSNRGFAGTSNLVATLLNTGVVSFASALQSYGDIGALGGTKTQSFSFVVTGICGQAATGTLQLQDGTTNLGLVNFDLRLGLPLNPLSEDFDYLVPPALPAGWTTSSSGGGAPWYVANSWSTSGYNSAFVSETGQVVSVKNLVSPSVPVSSPQAQLSFWQQQNMDVNFGGVLEISTNGSPFLDILAMGASFVSGGYSGIIYAGSGNPLEGRPGWTGSVSGSTDPNTPVFTKISLPVTTMGQSIQLRFRFGGGWQWVGRNSWALDSMTLSDGFSCCPAVANNLAVNATSIPDKVILGGNVAYEVEVSNLGPDDALGVVVTNTLPAGFGIQGLTFSQGVSLSSSNGSSLAFSIPTLAGGEAKTITIAGVALASGLLTNQANISRSDGGSMIVNNAIAITSVFVPVAQISDVTLVEGDSGTTNAVFNITLSAPLTTNATLCYATEDQIAVAGNDYVITNGVLTFAAGMTNQSIAVPIIGELLSEAPETFAVNLHAPTNLAIMKGHGIGTILDQDPLPYVSVGDATVVKPDSGTTNATFNVWLSTPSGQNVTVYFDTLGDSAMEVNDFIPTGYSQLTFTPGQTNLTINVVVLNHVTIKPSQKFYLELNGGGYAIPDRSKGVGTIVTALSGRLDHFSWNTIPSPQSNGWPFSITITARDFFEGMATNHQGGVALNEFSVNAYRTNTFHKSSPASPFDFGPHTWGYAFTPKTNLLVTHVRLAAESAGTVKLWKEDGTLLAQRVVNSTGGAWAETPLITPVLLSAGNTYRLSSFHPSSTYEMYDYYSHPIPEVTDTTISRSYSSTSDTFPTTPAGAVAPAALDIRYKVGVPTPLPLTPTISGNFSNSLWSGPVTAHLPGTNVALMASDDSGHFGISGTFNVAPAPGQLTHFAWVPIAPLQPVSNAFGVKLTALDFFNQVISNYAGSPAISASFLTTGSLTNQLLGNVIHIAVADEPDFTVGYSFTPKTNLTVTHVRHYFGNKVSIWTDEGNLLASRSVVSTPGSWVETALLTPLQLFAGQTYLIGAHTTDQVYRRYDMATNLADVIIKQGYYGYGDTFPNHDDIGRWTFVDFRYVAAFQNTTPVASSPTNSGAFTDGSWSGSMLVNKLVTNLTLVADDQLGHVGLSNPFSVGFVPGLLERFIWSNVPSPQTNGASFPVTITAVDHFNSPVTNFSGTVTLSAQAGLATPNVFPTTSSKFAQGVWAGSLFVFPQASNVVLRASDGPDRFGLSTSFDVVNPPLQPPLLMGPVLDTGAIRFDWNAVPGWYYQVQYKTNLSQAAWLNLGIPILATNPPMTWTALIGPDPQRFFRLEASLTGPAPLLGDITVSSGAIQFAWSAVLGSSYQVQYKTNLNHTNWLNLGSPRVATNSTVTWSEPIGVETQRFYRLQISP